MTLQDVGRPKNQNMKLRLREGLGVRVLGLGFRLLTLEGSRQISATRSTVISLEDRLR